MGLPSTLAGIIGFILTIVIILGMTAPDLYPDESKNIRTSQDKFQISLNATINQTTSQSTGFYESITNVFNFFTNAFSTLISFIILQVQYLFFFIGIMTILPSEFNLLFAIISSSFIIAIIKLLFFSGD